MTDYQLCGWRVRSEVPLPSLSPWVGDNCSADLVIRLGEAPRYLDALTYEAPLFQLGSDGRCRFEIKRVAAYLVDAAGQEVIVAPIMEPDAPDIGVFLLSTVLTIVCYRRNLMPLRASCVRIGDKAIAFVGASAAGKSVLATLFHQRGYEVLADDITVVDIAAVGDVRVLPTSSCIALWRADLEQMGYGIDGLERRRIGLEKYRLSLPNKADIAQPIPLAAIYRLGNALDLRHEKLEPVQGFCAVTMLNDAMHAVRLGRHLNGKGWIFSSAAQLAASIPVFGLARSLSLERNRALVAELAELYASSHPCGERLE